MDDHTDALYVREMSESRGLHRDRSVVHKFGRHPGLNTGIQGDVWYYGDGYPWPTVPTTLRAVSTSDLDRSGSTGATSVLIQGLDTTDRFMRLNRAWVSTSGAYTGGNVGRIDIVGSAAGQTLAVIALTGGARRQARLRAPRGRLGHGHEAGGHLLLAAAEDGPVGVGAGEFQWHDHRRRVRSNSGGRGGLMGDKTNSEETTTTAWLNGSPLKTSVL